MAMQRFFERCRRAFVPERDSALDSLGFRRGARERAFAKIVRFRLVIAPVLGSLAITFAFFEPTTWRRVMLGSAVLLLLSLSYVEWGRYRVHGIGAATLPVNLVVTAIGQIALTFATGGVFSPLLLGAVLLAFVGSIMVERRAIGLVVGVQVVVLWAMAIIHYTGVPVPSLVPEIFGEAGALEHGPAPWLAAAVATVILVAAVKLGGGARHVFEELFDNAIEDRDRALALHAEQTRAMTALSAELAHELKNPLSSVKGLSSLVAKDVDGKAAERLGVLRREVDRMQEILEELLDFSRPLVPLKMEDVDLHELAEDVALLHEATAADRSIPLEVRARGDVHLRCDPRKVRQVVINLVQNALDASPAGEAVELVVSARGGNARLEVSDRGSGIDPTVATRIFEPGVTTKEHGSGLGLVVARGLARQHGGELVLEPRSGGGATAVLTLPLASAT
jgi:two-component system sensor histidine kinase HydH